MQTLQRTIFTPAVERLWQAPMLDHIVPGVPYYFTPVALEGIRDAEHRFGTRIIETGQDAADVPLWNGEDLNGRRVAWFHDGRLGDELVQSAFYRQVKLEYPSCDLHVYSMRTPSANYLISTGNKFTGYAPRRYDLGFSEAQVHNYDYWILPEPVGYFNRYSSHENIYELLTQEIGIAPDISLPYVYLNGEEGKVIRRVIAEGLHLPNRSEKENELFVHNFWERLILIQLNASEGCRTPGSWYPLLRELRRALPGFIFALCGDRKAAIRFVQESQEMLPGLIFFTATREPFSLHLSAVGLLHLADAARLVIAPDSFLMHASAAFDTPCLALWQTEAVEEHRIPWPESRIGTYTSVCAAGMHEAPDILAEQAVGMVRYRRER